MIRPRETLFGWLVIRCASLLSRASEGCRALAEWVAKLSLEDSFCCVEKGRVIVWAVCGECRGEQFIDGEYCVGCSGIGRVTYNAVTMELEELF